MTTTYRVADVKGLTPAVEPARSDDLYVLNGQNYVFDSRGPRSIFGNRLLLPQALSAPEHTQGVTIRLRTGDKSFTFTSDSVLEWDEALGGWRIVYILPSLSVAPYRWTWAYLGEVLYFCHPRTGILVYDATMRICRPHTGPGVPAEVLAIEENNGFLLALTPVYLHWSMPSNGLDFTPTLGGAGFQKISERVPGYPIMVSSYTRGVLVWTTGGVMRSEFTGDETVYRHSAFQTEYRPINPFCTARIDDDSIVVLDERGLFQSRGDELTPYTPLFNEFIAEYIRDNDLKVGQNVRIEWDDLRRMLYVSTSLSYSDAIYENCFVLYANLDKWGQFNENHYGILPVLIQDSDRAGDYFGFVDEDRRVRYWLATGSREVRPEDVPGLGSAVLSYPLIQKPLSYPDDEVGFISGATGIANTSPSQELEQAAYYPWDGTAPVSIVRTGLDSKVVIGLFRFSDGRVADELSELINIVVRNASRDKTHVGDGYNLTPPVGTGYNLTLESEDGEARQLLDERYVNHQLKLVGTVDGESRFDECVPTLESYTRSVRHYSCSVVGLWHIIEISATEVGESFHPVTLEIDAVSAGRLN